MIGISDCTPQQVVFDTTYIRKDGSLGWFKHEHSLKSIRSVDDDIDMLSKRFGTFERFRMLTKVLAFEYEHV